MSNEITTHFIDQYGQNIMLLSQQQGSRLRDTVTFETVNGKRKSFDQVGKVAAVKRQSRHADTPLVETPHTRRWATLSDYELADLVDQQDKIRTLNDPTNSYVQAQAWAMGRSMDDEIITAATGTASTGQNGDGSKSFPSGQQIAHNYVGTGSASANNLTISKMRRAKAILDANEVPETDRYMAVTSSQIQDLLGDDEITSADYNSVRALVQGQVNTFLGFTIRRIERLKTDSSGYRRCLAYHKPGLGLAVGQAPLPRITERADKSYAVQAYISMSIGAVRVEEERVVEIKCDESANNS